MNKEQVYGSHKFVLEAILNKFEIASILEFGTGYCSTPLFLKNAKRVLSIEEQSEEWYNKIKDAYSKEDNFEIRLSLSNVETIDNFSKSKECFDLIFVDGHNQTRAELTNIATDHTGIIVCHDTEHEQFYRWDTIHKDNPGWEWFNIEKEYPNTSIFTNNGEVKNFLISKTVEWSISRLREE